MAQQIALSSPRISGSTPRKHTTPAHCPDAWHAAGTPRARATPAAGSPSPNVVCILGLPFDAVTTQDAAQRVRDAVQSRRRLFVSTPNLNFLVGCQRDAAFRQSVIDSDLSVADGMPLIWMSRLLGTPLPERVTGADLFERLREEPLSHGAAPIRVYFFGGPPGAAEAAARRLNARPSAMVCVGHQAPGYESVADLSRPETLDRINESGADFVVVALGAAKGQAWIQRNRERLQAPVIAHLGAVVNFEAGTVSRAPGWMQRAGLEWLWRIKEEPALWRRYGADALALLGLFVGKLLPHLLWRLVRRTTGADAFAETAPSDDGHAMRLSVRSAVPDAIPSAIDAALRECARQARPVKLDLGALDDFGPTFAGRLLRLRKTLAAADRSLELVAASATARRLLRWNGLESLLDDRRQVPAGAS